MTTITKLIFFIALLISLVVLLPIGVIWSLNTLFALSIPFTFETWLAVFILSAAVKTQVTTK